MTRTSSFIALLFSCSLHAQEIHGFVGYEQLLSGALGCNSCKGLNGGLRFVSRSGQGLLDAHFSFLRSSPDPGDSSGHEEQQHFGGSLAYSKSRTLGTDLQVEYGVEAGYYERTLTQHYLASFGVVEQNSIAAGPRFAVRYSKATWLQPYLVIHGFYNQPLITRMEVPGPGNLSSSGWCGVFLRLGALIRLSDGPRIER